MNGFVYLIRSDAGLYKVGYSASPVRRLALLQTASPYPLTLIGFVAGTREDESALHVLLRPWHQSGEWFRDCAAIQHLQQTFPPYVAPKAKPVEASDDAAMFIELLGGPTKAASALGITNPSVVMNWRSRGQVPADKVIAVESLTGISRHVLRPDIFGAANEVMQ